MVFLRRSKALGVLTLVLLSFGAVIVSNGSAFAQSGGLALPEDGAAINGTAQAGSAAVARDAQTAWLNPAGLTRLESREIMLSFQPFKLEFQFNPSSAGTADGSDGGDQGGWFPGGGLFYAAPVNEKIAWGFSATSPSGLILDPADDWVGRYFMVKTQFVAVNLEPSVGYRLSDKWSIGGGIDFQYAALKQDIAVNRPLNQPDGLVSLDGDSWKVGGSLSLLWESAETRRFGLRWRSAFAHDLTGDVSLLDGVPTSTGLTIPQSFTLSIYQDLSPCVALLFDFGWQDWSAFDKTVITIQNEGSRQVEIPRGFKDTWTFALGGHWQTSSNWLIMFGGGYTSAAVDDENRTPDLPADEQIRISLGAEHDMNDSWRLGLNYTWLWLGDNPVDAQAGPLTGTVVGDYDAKAHLIGFYVSWRP